MLESEKNLLASIISDPKSLHWAKGLVSGSDFVDKESEIIFDQVASMIARGEDVSAVTVGNRLADWGIKRIHSADVFDWVLTDVYPSLIHEYAQDVRTQSLSRKSKDLLRHFSNEVLGTTPPLTVLTDMKSRLERVIEGNTSGKLSAISLGELMNGVDAHDWIIPGILERQDRFVITGPEGFGKTTFCRQVAILSAAGINPFTFETMKPVKVLVVDAENTASQWRREARWIADLAAKNGLTSPRENMFIQTGKRMDLTKAADLADVHALVDEVKPGLIYIGPLYRLTNKALTTDDEASPLLVALDSLRERDCALLIEAHAGKGQTMDGDRDMRPRGSSALLGWPEVGVGLVPDKQDPNKAALVRWRGDRGSRNIPSEIVRGGRWPWTPTPDYVPFVMPKIEESELF